jgi:hypothetical protein
MAEPLESAIGQHSDIGGETNTEEIERVNLSVGMGEAEKIDGPGAAFENRLQGSLGAVTGEIAEEGVSGAERQEAERNALGDVTAHENAVENFVRGAVAADGEKAAIALIVGFARELDSMTGPGRAKHVDLQALLTQARDCRARKFGGAAATSRWVDDSKKAFLHVRTKCRINECFKASERQDRSLAVQLREAFR